MRLFPTVRKIARDPAIVWRYLRSRMLRARQRARFRRIVRPGQRAVLRAMHAQPPIPVANEGPIEVHCLCGRATVPDALAMLTTLYRDAPERYPLVIHEDGSFRPRDVALLARYFPGVRILWRRDTDATILPILDQRGFAHCAVERRRNVMMLKFFDLQYYAQGKRVLCLDTDILFHQRPTALYDALRATDWVDRYNEDVRTCYPDGSFEAARALGFELLPQVNAGLLVVKLGTPDFSAAEQWLTTLTERSYFDEQAIWAAQLSKTGAKPLPREYDVCFHQEWAGGDWARNAAAHYRGAPVVSQHYCGGPELRAVMYPRFVASLTDGPSRLALNAPPDDRALDLDTMMWNA